MWVWEEWCVMGDVGCVFGFEVDPRDGRGTEEAMRAIFDAMAVEEFPSGEVRTYTVYRDGGRPGRWLMFEEFSGVGSEAHASGPLMQRAGRELTSHFVAPFSRSLLEPVFVAGCGVSMGEGWGPPV